MKWEHNISNLLESYYSIFASVENIEPETEVSVTFVTNKAIQDINREYRGKDQPTDVISFALEELGEGKWKLLLKVCHVY